MAPERTDAPGPEPRANNPHNLSPGGEAAERTGPSHGGAATGHVPRWPLYLLGGVSVLAGILAIAVPFVASLTAAILVGGLLLGSGIVGLVTTFRRRDGSQMAAAFAVAVISVIAGLLMLFQPVAGILALTTLIIAFFAAIGALRVWYGAKSLGEGGGWMVATGVLSLALAALLWFGLPFNAAWVPGVLLGVDLIIWGTMLIVFGGRMGASASTRDRTA